MEMMLISNEVKVPPTTYCAQNILAEEKELLFLRVKPVEAESLPRVSKHCLQRHCMRAAGAGGSKLT